MSPSFRPPCADLACESIYLLTSGLRSTTALRLNSLLPQHHLSIAKPNASMSYQAPTAVYIRKQDGEAFLDEIEVGKKEKPDPQAGEVLVRILVRPVNPADILSMQGVVRGELRTEC